MKHVSYKEFKNLIHNELGLDKATLREYIEELVKEMAKEEVAKFFNDTDYIRDKIDYQVNLMIREAMGEQTQRWGARSYKDCAKDKIAHEIWDIVKNKLEISINVKEELA